MGAAAIGSALIPGISLADDPIRIIVPYPPGGPLDVTAELLQKKPAPISEILLLKTSRVPAATSVLTMSPNRLRTARPLSWAPWLHTR